jgi:hypothetical protein
MSIDALPRKSIPHIYSGFDEKYSMNPIDFIKIIRFINYSNFGKLSKYNLKLSEKVDGFSLKFGKDEHNEFFIESSNSGPVFDEGKFREFTIRKKGQSDSISEGYENILKILKKDTNLQNYLKSINTLNGIKIQTEALYAPVGKVSDEDDSIIKFVATWYKKKNLGSIITLVVINVTDGKGNQVEEVDKIKKDLKLISTNEIKFDDSDIIDFEEINLNVEIKQIEIYINNIEREFGKKIDDIINNQSRKRKDLEQKRKIKEGLLKFQKKFSNRLSCLIVSGKFGNEYEGLVFKLSNGLMFKVVSDRFKKAKKYYNKEYKNERI